ncbi:MAG TPA: hypothetical protein VF982_00290 [Anaerolineales bacterium]
MANAPFSPGFLPADNPISQWVSPRRNALLGFGAGMLSPGLSGAATGAMEGMALDRQYATDAAAKAKEAAETTQTTEWLKTNYPQYSNLPVTQAWQMAMQDEAAKKSGIGGNAPSNVQEWEHYNRLSPEDQSRYLIMKRANSPLNLGTEFVTQDPANPGATIGAPIAINNEQEAYDKGYGGASGKSDAESDSLYESMQSKMPGLRTVVDQLKALADTATYTHSGQAMDALKREFGVVGQGAIDRTSYIAIVDAQVLPLLRDTFGAAFTEKEGAALRATLGDPNLSPPEKDAILNAFIAQKERDVEAMRSRKEGGAAPVVRTFNPATGRLE